MATDAVPFDLLRSWFDELKLRFRAVRDSGIDNRAILIQQNKHAPKLRLGDFTDIDWLLVQAGGYPAGFGKSHLCPQRCADGSEIPIVAHGTSSGAYWRSDKAVPSFGFDRWHQVIGVSAVEQPAKAAGRLLDDLPENIRLELWDALPEGKSLPSSGWTLWSEAVFELAWKRKGKGIAGSPLKADRRMPVRFDKPDLRPLPDYDDQYSMRDWYSNLDNFAAASVQAIDILQSWLADELKREAEANDETAKPVETKPPTITAAEFGKPFIEEHRLRVILCMEAFPDLRKPLAEWAWDDCKCVCPEWQVAIERLLKRFGDIDGDPLRWGLRLRPPIMLVRWDEDAAIELGQAIRDDLYDAARSAAPAIQPAEVKPVDDVAETIKRVALMLGADGGKIMAVVSHPTFTTDQKLFALGELDERFKGYTSPVLCELLGVSPGSVTNSDTWRKWNPKPAKRAKSAQK